ncbi:hypothetical protein DENSPDRAFT_844742 [Dentipellis sp. KUC8613]|nr:hypothetical protein DENSPDRAFT_844742 [Dentipellis sp. KUC8613]
MRDGKSGPSGVSNRSSLHQYSREERKVTRTYFRPQQLWPRSSHPPRQEPSDKIRGTTSLCHAASSSVSSSQNFFANDAAPSYQSIGYRGVVVSELQSLSSGMPLRSQSVLSAQGLGVASELRHSATDGSDVRRNSNTVASLQSPRRQRGALSEPGASLRRKSTYASKTAAITQKPFDTTGSRCLRSSRGRVRLPVAAKSMPEISIAISVSTSLTAPVATAVPEVLRVEPSTPKLTSHSSSSSHGRPTGGSRLRRPCPSARSRYPGLWSLSSPRVKPKPAATDLDKLPSNTKTENASAKLPPRRFLDRTPKWPAVRATVGLLPPRINSDGVRESVVPGWSLNDFNDPAIRLGGDKQVRPPPHSSRLVSQSDIYSWRVLTRLCPLGEYQEIFERDGSYTLALNGCAPGP